jgi:uncharacterized membrane protein
MMAELRTSRTARYLIPTLIMLAGAALRLFQLDSQSLWYDEIFSVYFARTDLVTMFRGLALEGTNPPLYYALLHPIVQFGHYEFWLRLFSVGPGVLSIALIYKLARLLMRREGAVAAALLMAFNPFQVFFAREGRAYSLLTCIALLTVYAFIRLLEKPASRRQYRWWLVLGVGHALLSLIHIFGLLVIVFEFLVLTILLRRFFRLLQPWLVVTALSMIPFGAWTVYAYFERGHNLALVSPAFPMAGPGDLLLTFWNFSLSYAPPLSLVNLIGLIGLAALMVGGFFSLRRARWATILLLWLAPILIVFIVGTRRSLYGDRYLIVTTPALILLLAAGIAALRNVRLRSLVTILVAALTGLNAIGIYSNPAYSKEQWREAAQIIREQQAPGDVILSTDITASIAFNFYYQQSEAADRPFYSLQTDNPDLGLYRRAWLVLGYIIKSSHSLGQPDQMELPANLGTNPQTLDGLIAPNLIRVRHTIERAWTFRGVTVILVSLRAE